MNKEDRELLEKIHDTINPNDNPDTLGGLLVELKNAFIRMAESNETLTEQIKLLLPAGKPTDWIDRADIVRFAGKKWNTIYKAIHAGHLTAYVGQRYNAYTRGYVNTSRFSRAEVEEWIRNGCPTTKERGRRGRPPKSEQPTPLPLPEE